MNRCPRNAEVIDVKIIVAQGIAGKGKTMTIIPKNVDIYELLLYFWNSAQGP